MAWTTPKKVVICLNCKTEFSCYKNNKGLYCSGKCQQVYQRQKRADAKTLTERMLKRYLIEKYGEKCMMCGWKERNQTTNIVPIELDHIDGNSENNSVENGRIICPNCHSLQSTYGNLNRGRGRTIRRLRYVKGKSAKLTEASMYKTIQPNIPSNVLNFIRQFPHCDGRVLHAPGECRFCDIYPEWQALRIHWGIAFTGYQPDESKKELPCPAWYARGDNCQVWGGNKPILAP